MYIDSHAHMFYEDYKDDLGNVLRRAEEAGVRSIVVPGTTLETSSEAIALAGQYDRLYACVGFHPHEASHASESALREVEALSRHPKVVAIGEIGLDFHYDFAPRELQLRVFEEQVRIAIRRNLPIVVHTRESIPESIALVQSLVASAPDWRKGSVGPDAGVPAYRGVFHCFTGTAEECRQLFTLGFLVSYPGIVTFKNSPVIETLRQIGFDHILIETDSPYLSPVPFRGKRNEPSNLTLVVNKLAELFSTTPEAIGIATSLNARALFGIN
ncbi:MAG: TatD family hydrolase [Bacteroidota bacterium]